MELFKSIYSTNVEYKKIENVELGTFNLKDDNIELKKNEISSEKITDILFKFFIKNQILIEVLPSILLSLGGLIMAGELLSLIESWKIFEKINELFILVPILLGLKGNLEMTLAARLATLANLGYLDRHASPLSETVTKTKNTYCFGYFSEDQWKILFGNFAVLQIQSIIVGLFAGSWGWVLGGCRHGVGHLAIIVSSAIFCFVVSSMFLSILMYWMVMTCRKFKCDPDNVAIPVAASFGDFAVILMLAVCGKMFEAFEKYNDLISYFLIGLNLIGLILWIKPVRGNSYVKKVLSEGCISMILSVLLSSVAGVILARSIVEFQTMALLVPVLNGLTGNIASIYASRFSTSLHLKENSKVDKVLTKFDEDSGHLDISCPPLNFDQNVPLQCVKVTKETNCRTNSDNMYTCIDSNFEALQLSTNFIDDSHLKVENLCELNNIEINTNIYKNATSGDKTLKKNNKHAFFSLLALSTLIGSAFLIFVKIFGLANVKMDLMFFLVYSLVNLCLTIILLYVAHHFTSFIWSKGLDPDNISLPYITAVADVLGTVLIVAALSLMKYHIGPYLKNSHNINKMPYKKKPTETIKLISRKYF
ncbi:hypothetical protein HK099_005908 [Clydaea vesicula]|uniref:SLC41A/MgtE integral membrane domain-containing protein n=1 Tax=Clydaea vesicula TaxID=447962 RepID=A0AAD5XUL4_9FUNG|nr:hypothetical protein HK099_005908 [Clydaea vesicula]